MVNACGQMGERRSICLKAWRWYPECWRVTAKTRRKTSSCQYAAFGARSIFGVRGVRIYVDGIPATLPDGQGQLSHIDLGSAERVEVLWGPFSALYGNSSGGVVQVFTRQGEGSPVITPSAAFGGDGFSRAGMHASGGIGPMGYTLGVSQFNSGGYRSHSAASRSLGNARLDWDLQGGGKLTLVANQVRLRADDPPGLSRAQFDALPQSAAPRRCSSTPAKPSSKRRLVLCMNTRLRAAASCVRWSTLASAPPCNTRRFRWPCRPARCTPAE